MTVTIQFDSKLHPFTGGVHEFAVNAATVREAVLAVARAFPSLQARLLNCEGELRSIVRITINGAPAQPNDPVAEGDRLILQAG